MTKVISAIPQIDYTLILEFSDGKKKLFDTKPYLSKGIFVQLKDYQYFSRVRISFGTVTWPNEQDFSPETLYIESTEINYEIH